MMPLSGLASLPQMRPAAKTPGIWIPAQPSKGLAGRWRLVPGCLDGDRAIPTTDPEGLSALDAMFLSRLPVRPKTCRGQGYRAHVCVGRARLLPDSEQGDSCFAERERYT